MIFKFELNNRLLDACAKGYIHIVHSCFNQTKITDRKNLLECCNKKDGYTPLNTAIYYGNLQIVILLLDTFGANIENTGISNSTPLCTAISRNQIEIVSQLIIRNANINSTNSNLSWTPLMFAVRHNRIECAKILLKCAEINIDLPDISGWTPLHAAAAHINNNHIMHLLLRFGANVNIQTYNYKSTALHFVTRYKKGLSLLYFSFKTPLFFLINQ